MALDGIRSEQLDNIVLFYIQAEGNALSNEDDDDDKEKNNKELMEDAEACCSGKTEDRYCRVTCYVVENEVYDAKWCGV